MNLVVVATDPLSLRNVTRLAAAMDLDLVQLPSPDQLAGIEAPVAVVIDVELEGAMAAVTETKERWPLTMVVGLVSLPGGDIWNRAEQAGCDLVTTRGAVTKLVPPRLARWIEAPGGRRIRLFAVSDIAGRLGVVERLDDPLVGPLAVYHVGGDIRVVEDVCPHAGALLSYGEMNVDDGVVTCPEHGSRFDTSSGERVRGPADDGIRNFRVVVEDGQAFVQLDGG